MAYVVVSFKGQEIGRWPLKGPLTVGRSAECEVVVRDILLSRRHCEIAPHQNGWIASDLGSKNGTRVGGRDVTRRGLADGDVLTLGKTTVRFQIGRLPSEHKAPVRRPADPFEALSGTVTDFDPKAAEAFCRENNLPKPRPAPPEPASYSNDDLYSMLTEIASSSWDSIYAQASQPKRPIPRDHLKNNGHGNGAALATVPTTTSPGAAAPAEAVLTRRSRLGFAEELQVADTQAADVQAVDAQVAPVARPASPLVPAHSVRHSPGDPSSGRRPRRTAQITAWTAMLRPLAALHRWVAPAGRVRMF